MPFIQNISDEKQLVRVQGEKKILKPGEIAEVTEQELGITKTYSKIFQEINNMTQEPKESTTDDTNGSPESDSSENQDDQNSSHEGSVVDQTPEVNTTPNTKKGSTQSKK